jgi:hypothetical protein
MLLNKLDSILSFILLCFAKLLRYQSIELKCDPYDDKHIQSSLLDWIKQHTWFSTKTTIGERMIGYGIIFLKYGHGFLFLDFDSPGNESDSFTIQGWCTSNIFQELHTIYTNEQKKNESTDVPHNFEEPIPILSPSSSDKKHSRTPSNSSTESDDSNKLKRSNIYIYMPIGSYKTLRYRKQAFQYISYYDQGQPHIPFYLKDQYNAIQNILHILKNKQKKGRPYNCKALLTGPPGSGKSHVAYELAHHFPQSKLITEFSPIEPGDSFWNLLADLQKEKEKQFIILLINEFDILLERIESNKILFHKEAKTQITDMTKFLNWLDLISMLDHIILIFTTNRHSNYFPERVIRKGRIDTILEFEKTIGQSIDHDLDSIS